ncbi:MAG: hypothetical protein CR982_10220 [Candidatus Cloacimonadota bacterium]|nr:MAG: hypothetical protein CR982_10220 [Candidatus Cloacimonadota bacterium]PIE77550.1 MAG: hypothetical protein CSA15_12305 [Candidatus Delongbacteria bacterium]
MKKIAIISSKGGIGKTTTAVNLAHALSMKGKNVLLIDTDSQNTIGIIFGLTPSETLNDLLLKKRTSITKVRDGLHVITSGGLNLVDTTIKMAKKFKKESVLSTNLTGIEGIDYVIVDTASALSLLNINVLSFVDEVIIPLSMDFLSQVGTKQSLEMVKKVRELYNEDLKICGILPTFYNENESSSKETVAILKEHFPNELFSTFIRDDEKLREAPGYSKTIFEYDNDSKGAVDYLKLASEIENKNN